MLKQTAEPSASKAGRLLARILVPLGLVAAGLVTLPSAAQADVGPCYSNDPYIYHTKTSWTDNAGKNKRIEIKCYTGPGHSPFKVGEATLSVKWSGRTYVQVCDQYPDGIPIHIKVRWYGGTIYTYGDLGGYGDGCRTHRVGVSDSPSSWKYVGHDTYLYNWWVQWGKYYNTPYFVWPLHAV